MDIVDRKESENAIKNYTRTPNMLISGYQHLLPQEKWLFVCLMHLCGKEGTRYLSIRYIAQRTGFSPAVLVASKTKAGILQRLHDAGLIHIEKQRRKNKDGKEIKQEQYRVTITDTWSLNFAYFYEDWSTEEQIRGDNEPVSDRIPITYCSDSDHFKAKGDRIPITYCSDSDQSRSRETASHEGGEPKNGAVILQGNKITQRNKISKQNSATPSHQETDPFFDWFNEAHVVLFKEDALLSQRTDEERTYVHALLAKVAVTHDSLLALMRYLYNQPPGKTGFLWKEHLTVRAVCNNYERETANMLKAKPSLDETTTLRQQQAAVATRAALDAQDRTAELRAKREHFMQVKENAL